MYDVPPGDRRRAGWWGTTSIALLLSLTWGTGCDRSREQQAPAGGAGPTAEEAPSGGGAGGEPMAGAPGGPGAQPQVTVVTLEPQRVQLTRELPGRVSAFQIAEVRPQVSGIVKQRLFIEGDEVEAGQALYQLEDDTYLAAVAQAKAAVNRARAALKVAKQNAERSKMLFEGGAEPAQAHDATVAAYQLAQADLASARAALSGAEVSLEHARIEAPISGRIGKSAVTEGGLVTANQPDPLTTIQALDPVYVDVRRSSAELLELRRAVADGALGRDDEAPVTLLLEDGSRYPHPGTLRFADVSVDPSTGSFLVRVEVENPDAVLLPGMYVRAELAAGVAEDGLLVPQQGVTRDPQGQATALVVQDDGTVALKPLQTTQTVGSNWLVSGGLQAGDRVIVEGVQKVQPGAKVQATEASPRKEGMGGAGLGAPQSGEPPGSPERPGADEAADAGTDVNADRDAGH